MKKTITKSSRSSKMQTVQFSFHAESACQLLEFSGNYCAVINAQQPKQWEADASAKSGG